MPKPESETTKRETKPYYSGTKSTAFWSRIDSHMGTKKDLLYRMGCILQETEQQVLAALDEYEKD